VKTTSRANRSKKIKIVKRRILSARTNEYGDIAIWEDRDKDGKIVHVPGKRLTVTCKAQGIDCRRCFLKWGGSSRYPKKVYDGIFVDAKDHEQLLVAITERNLRSIKTAQYHSACKERQDRALQQSWVNALRKRYPSMPEREAEEIASFATVRGSGRVGRSSLADDPIKAATIAHIRHTHTEYDDLLEDGYDRWSAREQVGHEIAVTYKRWESSESTDEVIEDAAHEIIKTKTLLYNSYEGAIDS
jgi:hypothetical protein